MKKLLVILLVVVLGGGGYGTWAYFHNRNPSVRAERLTEEGKYREALVELRGASRSDPNNAEYHVRMGQLQAKLADPVAAEKEFRTAIQLGADRAALTSDLGEAVLVQGRPRDVLREVPPRAPNAELLAKNLLLRAVAQLSLSDITAAEATLAEAQARIPEAAQTSLIAARIAAARNQPDVMMAKLEDVLKRDPNQVEALLTLEKALMVKGDREAAMKLATRAAAAAPWSAMARIELANQYIYRNEDAKAQAEVDSVLRAQPRFMDAIYLNGILMARKGQLAEAAQQFAKLDTVADRLPSGLYFQALIALQAGNLQTAAEFARRYNQLVPQDPEGMRLRAQIELSTNHPADALPAAQRLAELQPKDAEAQDLLGQALAGTGQLEAAGKAFQAAVTLKPDDATMRYHLGALQFRRGEVQPATDNLGKAFAADPKIAGLGLTYAQALAAGGQGDKAEGVLNKTRTELGDSPILASAAAALRVQARDLLGARTILVEAARKFPDAVDLRVELARVLAQSGQAGEAMTLLQAVLAKEPARFNAVSTMINIQASEGDLPGAIKTLDAAHRAAPRDIPLVAMLADAQIAIGDPKTALNTLGEMTPDALGTPLLASALGRAQAAAGRPEQAIETFRNALKDNPKDLLLRRGLVDLLAERKDYAAVAKVLDDGLALYPQSEALMSASVVNAVRAGGLDAGLKQAEALRQRPGGGLVPSLVKGDLLLAANEPKRAAEAYRAEYEAAPSLPLLVRAAGAYTVAGDTQNARSLLTGWLDKHPGDPEASQRLAQLDIQAGDWDAAKKNLATVLDKEPDNPMALNNLAWVYLNTGDNRALATAQRAYLRDPRPAAGDTLGWILFKTGSAKAALPLLQRAANQQPNDPGIRYHLAAVLAADGKPQDAAKLLDGIPANANYPDAAAAQKLAADLRAAK